MAGNTSTGDPGTRVDMHVKVLDESVAKRAKDRGIDVLVYAPHFTRLPEIKRRAERFSDEELLVIPAREVFTGDWHSRRHLLAVGLSRPVPDFITFEGAMQEFERQNAVVLVPHPEFATVSLTGPEIHSNLRRLHGIEIYNAKLFPHQNGKARTVARETGLSGFGSSYAHLRRTVGEAWTQFDAEIRSETDLLEALRDGSPRRVLRRNGAGHRLRGLAEYAHLFWENTYEKFDRVFLSGTEPTHPTHVAYDGRFDDVTVRGAHRFS
ncbi:metal-dependent phosphoesterase (PHP family) [Halalkaliarchaeum desulfuricum]|uniref:Metal-dependent phosphoesterase (PHP family) n=2 Tax=Halalkaliarchaeum desulfuricum TaxID=2055893 RepID=A0A343TID1_9EURY|nr:metal-dependent phosphoesterase (PHP family) [Halalkaliarchaeum desulfuricum]